MRYKDGAHFELSGHLYFMEDFNGVERNKRTGKERNCSVLVACSEWLLNCKDTPGFQGNKECGWCVMAFKDYKAVARWVNYHKRKEYNE